MSEANQVLNGLPLVTVVIPAYKAERWIGETIRSVQAQTYRNLEIIVVDDGSPDNLADIVLNLAEEDDRIRLVRKQNGGLPAARNSGIHEAKGEYIAPVDADDIWYPEKIEKQVGCFLKAKKEGTDLGLVYCWSQSIDENGNETKPKLSRATDEGMVYHNLLLHNFTSNGSSAMMPKSLLIELGGYPEQMTSGCEDWALYLRIAHDHPFGVVSDVLVGYRQLESSMSRGFRFMLKGHSMLLDYLKSNNINVSEHQVRHQKNWIFIYTLCRSTPLFSKRFFQSLTDILRVDPAFCFRPYVVKTVVPLVYYKLLTSFRVLRKKLFNA